MVPLIFQRSQPPGDLLYFEQASVFHFFLQGAHLGNDRHIKLNMVAVVIGQLAIEATVLASRLSYYSDTYVYTRTFIIYHKTEPRLIDIHCRCTHYYNTCIICYWIVLVTNFSRVL